MEPFRIFVDRKVILMQPTTFDKAEKHTMWSVMNDTVTINHTKQTCINAIKIYTKSVFEAINDNDVSEIVFPQE